MAGCDSHLNVLHIRSTRLPVPGMVDKIDLTTKFQAVDHYARVFITKRCINSYLASNLDPHFKRQPFDWLDRRDNHWVNAELDDHALARPIPESLLRPEPCNDTEPAWFTMFVQFLEKQDLLCYVTDRDPVQELRSGQAGRSSGH